MKMKTKKIIALVLAFAFIVTGAVYAENPAAFVDWEKGNTWPMWLDTNPEAKAQVEQAITTDLLAGYTVKGQRHLLLNQTITRAEYAALLGRVLNLGQDTGTPWYQKRVDALAAAGIITDISGDWNAPIKRDEMGNWIGRAVTKYNVALTKPEAVLPDIAANPNIVNAVQAGIIAGYTDGLYHPERTALRVEGVLMLVRLQNSLPDTGETDPDENGMGGNGDVENGMGGNGDIENGYTGETNGHGLFPGWPEEPTPGVHYEEGTLD